MNAEDQDLTDVYELLEEMTPPEVRLARQMLGEMHQLWEALIKHEERLLGIEDAIAGAPVQRIKVIEGALEELILRVEELRGTKPAPKEKPKKAKVAGVYCRNCSKRLEGRQKVFCTKRCAAVWHGQHRGEFATPRFEIEEKLDTTVVAGEGIRDNGKAAVAEKAFA